MSSLGIARAKETCFLGTCYQLDGTDRFFGDKKGYHINRITGKSCHSKYPDWQRAIAELAVVLLKGFKWFTSLDLANSIRDNRFLMVVRHPDLLEREKMKVHDHLLTMFLVVCCGFANAADGEADKDRLAASLKKWKTVKEECGGNYTLKFARSTFTGSSFTTTVTIKDNVVVERSYDEFIRQPGLPPVPEDPTKPRRPAWTEKGKEIGSHKDASIAPARTLDELYAEAEKIVSMEPPANHVRNLGIDKQGLLVFCFLRDRRIADDAPLNGVRPFTIEIAKKK